MDCFNCLAWFRKRRSGRLLSTPTWMWTSPSDCAAEFLGGVEGVQTGPTLYTQVHLSWLSKLGRWQRNRRVVGFTSVSLSQAGNRSRLTSLPCPKRPGYTAQGTRSRPLLLVQIQEAPRGSWSRTWGLRHSGGCFRSSVDFHPYQYPVSMLTPIYPSWRVL